MAALYILGVCMKNNTQKKIYVWAFFQQNLGDDMFVQTLVRRYPQHRFFIAANPDYVQYLAQEPNVVLMSRVQFFLRKAAGRLMPGLVAREKKRRMKQADAVVKIGGSVFMEYPGWQNAPAEIPNSHFFIVGANFGPYTSEAFFEEKKRIITRATDCCFRDLYSYRLFENIPHVRYAPDILWGYPWFPKRTNGNGVGISVLNLSAFSGLEKQTEEYERNLAHICDLHCGQGDRVVLFGFCGPEGDKEAVKRVLSYCKNPEKIELEYYGGDISGFLDAFNKVDVIYASRFHAMILGFAMGKRVIPIIYSRKQTHTLEDIGFKGACWNVLENEPLNREILQGKGEALSDSVLNEYRKRAQEQFSGLNTFLSN